MTDAEKEFIDAFLEVWGRKKNPDDRRFGKARDALIAERLTVTLPGWQAELRQAIVNRMRADVVEDGLLKKLSEHGFSTTNNDVFDRIYDEAKKQVYGDDKS